MKNMKDKNKDMKLSDMYYAVNQFNHNHDYKLRNVFIHGWEADAFSVTSSIYSYEFEIKISRSDFLADFKKPKHELFKNGNLNHKNCPNKFFFCCPNGMININEIPEYAGLINVETKYKFKVIKRAPFLHRDKFDVKNMLFNKYYWMYITQKRILVDQKQIIEDLQSKIDKLEKTSNEKNYF